jgi:hypothetical protein
MSDDEVNHPAHYKSHPSGVECIEITRHMSFTCGNVVKYLWRAGLKVRGDETGERARLRDLEKALWYLNDEVSILRASLLSLEKPASLDYRDDGT